MGANRKEIIFPIIVPQLDAINDSHWNSTVHSLTANVVRMLNEIDEKLYAQMADKHRNQIKNEKLKRQNFSGKIFLNYFDICHLSNFCLVLRGCVKIFPCSEMICQNCK